MDVYNTEVHPFDPRTPRPIMYYSICSPRLDRSRRTGKAMDGGHVLTLEEYIYDPTVHNALKAILEKFKTQQEAAEQETVKDNENPPATVEAPPTVEEMVED